MCSIFAVVDKKRGIDIERCRNAHTASILRGPDYAYTYIQDNIFIECKVLSITGTTNNSYFKHNNLFLAYNGEIYQDYEYKLPDTNFILKEFKECNGDFKGVLRQLDGMFGIVLHDSNTNELVVARDVQGEKTLYIYESEECIIISSTIACIDVYVGGLSINYRLNNYYLHTRHFLTYNKSIYEDVQQVQPGSYIIFNTKNFTRKKTIFKTLADAYCEETLQKNITRPYKDLLEELDHLLDKNIKQMIPKRACSVSFSGGIDSSLIAAYMNKYTSEFLPIAINCIGKDYITQDLSAFKHHITPTISTLNITEKEWYDALHETYKIVRMPLPSHNYCTKKILTKFLKQKNIKVCLGGEGADELFGGYDFYCNIQNEATNISPYSSFIQHSMYDNEEHPADLAKYLNKIWNYYYKLTGDTVAATSYTDTYLVVADDGLRNSDQIYGYYGIEGRSPFMRWEIIKFAFNLPSKYKRGKVLLRDLFHKYYPNVKIHKKQGFTGFPCESYNYFPKKIHNFDVLALHNITNIPKTPALLWKLFNLQYFYECYNSRYICNHS